MTHDTTAGPPKAPPATPPDVEGDVGTGSGREGTPPDGVGLEALRALVHESDEAMLLSDGHGRIAYANPACGRLLGASPENLIGRSGADFVRPDHQFIAREAFTRAMATAGQAVCVTVDLINPAGGFRAVDAKTTNHLATPGVEAVVWQLRDATPTAGELGESYRALFKNALVGMGVADMRGNLLAFNDAMLKPGGYTREDIEAIGNVAKLYANDADRPRVLQILRAKGYVWRELVPFVRKDGSAYDTLLTLTPVVFLGEPCLYATVEEVGEGRR